MERTARSRSVFSMVQKAPWSLGDSITASTKPLDDSKTLALGDNRTYICELME
jgi:hypothetical protein